ncbi:MAG: autoinducer binding domain-containing protein [Burkholderiales bacterium]
MASIRPPASHGQQPTDDLPDETAQALDACRRAPGVSTALASLAAIMGFDGLSYIVLQGPGPQARVAAHWSSAGAAWTARYATRAYHLVDPRVRLTRGRAVPVGWSNENAAPDTRSRAFAHDATQHAIGGGVAMAVHDASAGRAVIAWDRGAREARDIDASPRRSLGTLALVGGLLHEGFAAQAGPADAGGHGLPLTDRERECVSLVARGMTSADVGAKLGISARTANFHMGNVMEKLGAMSRSEAIARAMAANIVSLDG